MASVAYFLLIGLMQMVPAITVSQGKPTMFLPLAIVILVSMAKDFAEDLKRRKSDRQENNSKVQLLGRTGFTETRWAQLKVGDIIKVKKDEYVPCDILLLQHTQQARTAFVETKNMDGETNLKLRRVCDSLQHLVSCDPLRLYSERLVIHYEKPNPQLGIFRGNIEIQGVKYPLENSNVLLRGCSLKINAQAVGLCLYTGMQTKILMNAGRQSHKQSTLEKQLNGFFRVTFGLQFGLTLVSAIIFGSILAVSGSIYSALTGEVTVNIGIATIFSWGSWFINFSNFVPISLLVTVEMVRFGQGILLSRDQLCVARGQGIDVQTSSLNQQLGQVQYVLSDKTGTLTENKMEFKCLWVNGVNYGHLTAQTRPQSDPNLQFKAIDFEGMQAIESLESKSQKTAFSKISHNVTAANVDFSADSRQALLSRLCPGKECDPLVSTILLHLALCHHALPEKDSYASSSPDELALVSFAKFAGYAFTGKDEAGFFKVELRNETKSKAAHSQLVDGLSKGSPRQLSEAPSFSLRFKVLHMLQFSSERKKMSVILKDENGSIVLLTKGADDVIFKSLSSPAPVEAQKQLDDYACEGLRTLVLAMKIIPQQEYSEWAELYRQACASIAPNRLQMVQQLQSKLEKGLELVGLTAIQDKLQPLVKQTVQQLRKANIKVWMLTGDKKETAMSIGYACGIMDRQTERIILDCQAEHVQKLIDNVMTMGTLLLGEGQRVAIMSGDFFESASDSSKKRLQTLLKTCDSAICCRVSPRGKEKITEMVRQWGVTLGIGDGANDVNMINMAHVGVGVRGVEGSQATRAADFVVSEFRLLQRLLLYHGLNFYARNSTVMLYNLYKNMLLTLPLLFYGPLSVFSATYLYETWVFQFYNLLFVSLPIIYLGLFNERYSWKQVRRNPLVYVDGQQNRLCSWKAFFQDLGAVFGQSILLLYLGFYLTEVCGSDLKAAKCSRRLINIAYMYLQGINSSIIPLSFHSTQQFQASPTSAGYIIYLEWSGMLLMNAVIIIANLRIVHLSHQISRLQAILLFLGPLSYYLIFFLVSIVLTPDSMGTLGQQLGSGTYWALIFGIIAIVEGFSILSGILQQDKPNQSLQVNRAERVKSIPNAISDSDGHKNYMDQDRVEEPYMHFSNSNAQQNSKLIKKGKKNKNQTEKQASMAFQLKQLKESTKKEHVSGFAFAEDEARVGEIWWD